MPRARARSHNTPARRLELLGFTGDIAGPHPATCTTCLSIWWSSNDHADQCCTWRCNICDAGHATEQNARNCCPEWLCSSCDARWETYIRAERCCPQFTCIACGDEHYAQESAWDCCDDPYGDEDEDRYHDPRDRRGLQDWDYRPSPVFFDSVRAIKKAKRENKNKRIKLKSTALHGPLSGRGSPMIPPRHEKQFFGFELEMAPGRGSNGAAASRALEILGNHHLSDLYYCKYDGSVPGGFEVVSHPLSWSTLREIKSEWNELLGELHSAGMRSYIDPSCGMHVHLSREPFLPPIQRRPDHDRGWGADLGYTQGVREARGNFKLLRLMQLVYHNPNFMKWISQRTQDQLNSWCRLFTPPVRPGFTNRDNNNDRYSAVNIRPRNTVELRIFRGNMTPEGFWKNMQLSKALYDLSLSNELGNDTSSRRLVQYINDQPHFKELKSWMQQRSSRMEEALTRDDDAHRAIEASRAARREMRRALRPTYDPRSINNPF